MKSCSNFIQAVAGPSTYGNARARPVVRLASNVQGHVYSRAFYRPAFCSESREPVRPARRSSSASRIDIRLSRTGSRPYSSSSTRPPAFSPLLALAPLTPSSPSLDTLDPSLSTSPSILDPLVQFLLSSPLPAGLTILILTFAFRSAVTLPATIWQRRRMERTKRIVQPEMRRINEKLAGVVAIESRKKGLGYEEYKKELKRQLAKAQSALHKQHKTHPLPTLLVPLAVHIPLLITLSLTIRRTIETPGSPWATEGWWWLTHLGEVDPTMILPVVGGVVGMINAEAVGWRNKVLREAEAGEEEGKGKGRDVVPESKGTGGTMPPSSPSIQPIPTPGPASSPASSTPPRPVSSARTLPGHLVQGGGNGARPATKPRPATRSITTTSSLLALPAPPRPKRPPGPSSQVCTPPAKSLKPRPQTPNSDHLTPLANSSPTSTASPTPAKPKLSTAEKSRLTSAIITNAMRFGSILFIPIAAQVPAALALYWTGSMCFTLGQNLILNGMDVKEKRRREAEAEMEAKS